MSPGDVMRFRKLDDTGGVEEDEWVVSSVDPAGPSITLTTDPSGGAVDWVAELASGVTLELVAGSYNATGIVDAQKQYTYVGDDASLSVDGDPLKEFAP